MLIKHSSGLPFLWVIEEFNIYTMGIIIMLIFSSPFATYLMN